MATNKWTKWDEAAEFAIKVGPLSILFTCMAIAVAGMFLEKEYPEIVDDLAKVGSGALAPFSIKGIKELLDQEGKDSEAPTPPPTEPEPIMSMGVPQVDITNPDIAPQARMGFQVPSFSYAKIGNSVDGCLAKGINLASTTPKSQSRPPGY